MTEHQQGAEPNWEWATKDAQELDALDRASPLWWPHVGNLARAFLAQAALNGELESKYREEKSQRVAFQAQAEEQAALNVAQAALLTEARTIENAPKDRTILVWAPGREGLPAMFALCKWHPDAGFCIDELRQPIMWWDGEWGDTAQRALAEAAEREGMLWEVLRRYCMSNTECWPCGGKWEVGQPERHAPGCLAAPTVKP